MCWIHNKCNCIKEPLRPNPDFGCARCLGTAAARPIGVRTVKGVKVDEEKLEAVSEFCCLSAGGGCELAAVTLQMCLGLVPPTAAPSHHHNPLLVNRGRMYSTCERSVMLQRLRP